MDRYANVHTRMDAGIRKEVGVKSLSCFSEDEVRRSAFRLLDAFSVVYNGQ